MVCVKEWFADVSEASGDRWCQTDTSCWTDRLSYRSRLSRSYNDAWLSKKLRLMLEKRNASDQFWAGVLIT